MSPEVAFLNPPMTFRDLRSLPPPSLDFLVTSPLSMLALTLATWPGAPWVSCGDTASSGTAPASTSGEALSSGIATGVVSAGERVVMVALDGSLSRGPPVSGVPAMSTQSISSASEAALFGAGKWDTSVNIARYAEKGTTRAPSARGRREIRRAAVVVDVETESERCVGARLESHLSRTLPSSAPLATPRPTSGVVAGSGDGTGSCAIVNGAHRVVRWCEVTVNPHPRFFVAWNFAFSVGRHSILVGVLWTKRAK